MAPFDIKKEQKQLYSASNGEISVLDVPAMSFLMIDGKGDPNTAPAFRAAVEALYSLAYSVKFRIKKADSSKDFVVPPLEGLWWADDMSAFIDGNRNDWQWTLMIMQPGYVTPELIEAAAEDVRRKKKKDFLSQVRLQSFEEGLSAQVLHVGPYSDECQTIRKLHAFITARGHEFSGKHHEIYLSDPRRTAPEKLKTILRQPMSRKKGPQ